MAEETPPRFEILSITELHPDINQPRKNVRDDSERGRLIESIKKYGIEVPLSVMWMEEGKYNIIDGHRRYFAAKDLNLQKIPCRIYPPMHVGDLESRRFEIQNNRKSWKPLERAGSINEPPRCRASRYQAVMLITRTETASGDTAVRSP